MIIRILIVLILVLIGLVIAFFYNNLYYYKLPLIRVRRKGFEEKKVTLDDETVINYGEGGNGDIPLLLIHGQVVAWKDYMEALPKLSNKYHIYAIDCHGHGKSSHDSTKYNAVDIGNDIVWFIKNVVKEPVVISGHSSGGLLTAWIAANHPENVKGIVLEDPPLFSCEANRTKKTFAYLDTFEPINRFIQNKDKDDYTLFYLQNCKWLRYFGESREKIINYAVKYRKKHPNEELKFSFLPPNMTRIFHFIDDYDYNFGYGFFDGSWMQSYNHQNELIKIKCPSILIHTNWSYDKDNILLAAMDDNDAKKACSLIENCRLINVKSGHDFHAQKPKQYVDILNDFADYIAN